MAVHHVGTVLSAVHLSVDSAVVPVHTDLLPIRPGSTAQIRAVERVVAHDQAIVALPSVGRQRLRPRALKKTFSVQGLNAVSWDGNAYPEPNRQNVPSGHDVPRQSDVR